MQNRKPFGRNELRRPRMRREKPTITELSFFLCGFLVIIVGWLADLLGVFELNTVTGGHSTGTLQLYALNDHLGEAFPAAFFGVFSGLQLAAAFLIPYSHKDLDWAWLGITAFLVMAYIVTRTVSVWPIGYVEDLDALGVISKVVEVLTVLFLLSLMQSERVARRKTAKVAAVSTR